jgi:hypothetical protein
MQSTLKDIDKTHFKKDHKINYFLLHFLNKKQLPRKLLFCNSIGHKPGNKDWLVVFIFNKAWLTKFPIYKHTLIKL